MSQHEYFVRSKELTPSIVYIPIFRFNETIYLKFFFHDFAVSIKITHAEIKNVYGGSHYKKLIKSVLFKRNLSTNQPKTYDQIEIRLPGDIGM